MRQINWELANNSKISSITTKPGRGEITKFIDNCWAGTKEKKMEVWRQPGKCSWNFFPGNPFLGQFLVELWHPIIGKYTTLCRPLDRGFESSLFQNMDVPPVRAVAHLSSFLLVLPSFFFCHFLFTYLRSSLHASSFQLRYSIFLYSFPCSPPTQQS